MKLIDTFSANSLKLLDENPQEFIKRYEDNLYINKKDEKASLGQKFHNLLNFYIKGFDISKLLFDLDEKERSTWKNLENYLKDIKNDFIKTEYPFLVKEELNNKPYFLTGRLDALYFKNNQYIIYDWKTLNIPKNPKEDLQSIVYLFCLNKIFNTDKIKMRYLSIEKLDFCDVEFENSAVYKEKIDKIILKQFKI